METKEKMGAAEAVPTRGNKTICIYVQANKLYNLRNYPPTEQQMDDLTALRDESALESGYGDANKDFQTDVFLNYNVTWEIFATNPTGEDRGYEVALRSVFHNPTKGNPNFFNQDSLPVGRDGNVTGQIVSLGNLQDENYTIKFTVKYGSSTYEYNLDPKLKVNQ